MNKNPNIVFILTDDQGYWSLGCYGNKEIRTPNIDRLADSGVRFQNFFCASPVCSPARASLLTGRIPSQHGVLDWIRVGNGDSEKDTTNIEYLEGIPGYTEILRDAGYVCGQSGKWHMGDTGHPQKGYSHWFTTTGGSGTYHNAPAYRGTQRIQTEGYLTDVITDDALDFIQDCYDNHRSQPFYLNLAFTAPHSPHVDQHKQEYVDYYYNNCSFSDVRQDPRNSWSISHPIDIQYSETFCSKQRECLTMRDLLSGYYAAVQGIDDSVGRIIEKLKKIGIIDDTIIVYMSDNGFSAGQHGIWGKGNCTSPLNMFDTCVKVPCIFSYPKLIKKGIVNDSLMSAYDFMPTLLELAGVHYSVNEELPGRSFARSMIEGKEKDYHHSILVYDEYGPARMVRSKEWKYVHRYPDGPDELYDLLHDPDEIFNLINENRYFYYGPSFISKKIEEMKKELEEWFGRYSDKINDGKNEPVFGRGQMGKLTEDFHGSIAFHPAVLVEYRNDKK